MAGIQVPRFIIRDRDRVYGHDFAQRPLAMGIRDRPIFPWSPWENAYAERLIGSIRRACPGPHCRVRLTAPAPRSCGLRSVLQRGQDASGTRQGCVCITLHSDRRKDHTATDPVRAAPPLCPELKLRQGQDAFFSAAHGLAPRARRISRACGRMRGARPRQSTLGRRHRKVSRHCPYFSLSRRSSRRIP